MLSLASAAVVAAIALAAPLVLGLTGIRLPEVVLEILLGIAIGPQVLNWAQVDEPVRVLSLAGLAFLLLLSGLEIDTHRCAAASCAARRPPSRCRSASRCSSGCCSARQAWSTRRS